MSTGAMYCQLSTQSTVTMSIHVYSMGLLSLDTFYQSFESMSEYLWITECTDDQTRHHWTSLQALPLHAREIINFGTDHSVTVILSQWKIFPP